MSDGRINLLSFTGRIRILHLTWFAFFLSFVAWFNHAPLMLYIKESLSLDDSQVKALFILNVALTIPARIVVGILVDKFGPRLLYTVLLAFTSIPCLFMAFANSFEALAAARLLMGFVGAGFVIGIRMIGDWFPDREVGTAGGIYGGWGNFGSAFGAMVLPTIAVYYGAQHGWRYAVGTTGAISLIYSVIYFFSVSDVNTVENKSDKVSHSGVMKVSNLADLFFYLLMSIPPYAVLSLIIWKISKLNNLLTSTSSIVTLHLIVWSLFIYNFVRIIHANTENVFRNPSKTDRGYRFKQIAILDFAYFATFGSELAVISMLPLFFFQLFSGSHSITMVNASLLASGFAFVNLVARPLGGWLSDKIGCKKSLTILLAGMALSFFGLSYISSSWPLLFAVLAVMTCSIFVQGGEGAVFAMVPLVKKNMTGQIAGMVGAYGNIGAVIFLTVLSFVSPKFFLLVISATAALTVILVQFLDEPQRRHEKIETSEVKEVKMQLVVDHSEEENAPKKDKVAR